VYPNGHNREGSGPAHASPTRPPCNTTSNTRCARVVHTETGRPVDRAGVASLTPAIVLLGAMGPDSRSCPIAAPATNEPRINDRIRAREVRLVSAEGEQIGIKPLPEALAIARAADLDLVEVAPQANPPVCRIMDYGKFKYEAAQRAKESRRKTTQISIKEMKYRVKIGKGDFDTKTKKVEHFLGEGHKVKITIMFRGREVAHPELGMKILDNVAEQVKDLAKVEAAPKLDGRNMVMVLAPDKRAQDAAKRRAAEANGEVPPPEVGEQQEEAREPEAAPDGQQAQSEQAPAEQAQPEQ
jgi:translation initiation factor IF-3